MRHLLSPTIVFVCLIGACGCGPSARELREKTLSALNTEADRWDGGPDFKTDATDAYGNTFAVSVTKGIINYDLELRSHGPDALPKNSDDLTVRCRRPHGESTVNKEIERGSESVGRGGIRGVIQGAKEAFSGKGDAPVKKKE